MAFRIFRRRKPRTRWCEVCHDKATIIHTVGGPPDVEHPRCDQHPYPDPFSYLDESSAPHEETP